MAELKAHENNFKLKHHKNVNVMAALEKENSFNFTICIDKL